MKDKYPWLDQAIADLPGAKRHYKAEWETDVFLVGEKIFAMLAHPKMDEELLTVKGEPSKNEEFKELYQDVIAGYHMNKTHWISLRINSPEISQAMMEHVLQAAYYLVFSRLPKKTQKKIKEDELL